MSQDKYFRDELAFLKEQGKEFSDMHPQLARYLHGKSTDPDVERLLEGFAFLTGRLRQKIDDDFPELTHSMINMLWPNYLRPVPSTTIIAFTPNEGMDEKQLINTGCEMKSHPVSDTICQFRTCRDVDIYPFTVEDIISSHSRESSTIDVVLSSSAKTSLQQIGLDDLRFYLGNDDYSAKTLYLWLNNCLDSIELIADGKAYTLMRHSLKAVGFDSQDAILPYPKNVYEGYRILQEYFTFPEAFHFVDVTNIHKVIPSYVSGDFTLRFKFSKTLPSDVRINKGSMQLYCVPAINLFEHDADPIELNGRRTEYPIIPSSRKAGHYEIFSVDHVQGWIDSEAGRIRGQNRVYTPFESFQHEIERTRHRLALYYRIKVRDSIRHDGFEHLMSFVRSDETHMVNMTEAVSLRLTCTNRQLPKELGKGDICIATNKTPSFVTFKNITEPSASLRPPLDGSLLWTLISNLSLNYLSLLSKDALCSVIRAYDFKALVDRQAEMIAKQRLAGILDITSGPTERIVKGLPVRGLKSEVTLKETAFGSEGDLFLFGSVLSRFFSLYASINSFHELVVVNADNQERYTWNIQIGQQPLI